MSKTNTRLTPQKKAAIAAFHAGMSELEACKHAGYARPDTAATNLFDKDEATGLLYDDAAQRELDRLRGVRQADELALEELDDLEGLPKAVLAELARTSQSATARVAAAKALDTIRQREIAEEKAATSGRDSFAACNALRMLLGMPPFRDREAFEHHRQLAREERIRLADEWAEFVAART